MFIAILRYTWLEDDKLDTPGSKRNLYCISQGEELGIKVIGFWGDGGGSFKKPGAI